MCAHHAQLPTKVFLDSKSVMAHYSINFVSQQPLQPVRFSSRSFRLIAVPIIDTLSN